MYVYAPLSGVSKLSIAPPSTIKGLHDGGPGIPWYTNVCASGRRSTKILDTSV